MLNCRMFLLVEEIKVPRWPACNVVPDPIGQRVSGKEHHAVDWPALIISHQGHFLAMHKPQTADKLPPVVEELPGYG